MSTTPGQAPPAPPVPVKAATLTLSKRSTVEQAFGVIATNCLTQMTANRNGVAKQHDVESLHQLRVALRRLRTLLGSFKKVLPAPAQLQQELKWLGAQLGPARDWDVLATSTLPTLTTMTTLTALTPNEADLDQVRLAALMLAQQQHALAATALNSVRYAQLIKNCASWIADCGWRDTMTPRQRKRLAAPVKGYAVTTLRRQHNRLLERGKKLRSGNPAQRHRVRIAAKKVRYACEFFQALYRARKMAPYLAALARLQDRLGWLNDGAIACVLLGQLHQPELAASTGFLRGHLAACLARDAKKCAGSWKKFKMISLPD